MLVEVLELSVIIFVICGRNLRFAFFLAVSLLDVIISDILFKFSNNPLGATLKGVCSEPDGFLVDFGLVDEELLFA